MTFKEFLMGVLKFYMMAVLCVCVPILNYLASASVLFKSNLSDFFFVWFGIIILRRMLTVSIGDHVEAIHSS